MAIYTEDGIRITRVINETTGDEITKIIRESDGVILYEAYRPSVQVLLNAFGQSSNYVENLPGAVDTINDYIYYLETATNFYIKGEEWVTYTTRHGRAIVPTRIVMKFQNYWIKDGQPFQPGRYRISASTNNQEWVSLLTVTQKAGGIWETTDIDLPIESVIAYKYYRIWILEENVGGYTAHEIQSANVLNFEVYGYEE